jgi:hypothetical protein
MEKTEEMAAYLLTVPCEVEQCEGLFQILVIAKRGLPPADGTAMAAGLFATGIQCDKGHRSTGPFAEVSSITLQELPGF